MTVQLPGVTTKLCPTCRDRPRLLDRSYCGQCDAERRKINKRARQLARAQGVAPALKRRVRARGDRELCNCGDVACSGLMCDFVRPSA